jgi:hypothetical protein
LIEDDAPVPVSQAFSEYLVIGEHVTARPIFRIASSSRPPDPRWDVSGDKRVTSLDVLMMLQAAGVRVQCEHCADVKCIGLRSRWHGL